MTHAAAPCQLLAGDERVGQSRFRLDRHRNPGRVHQPRLGPEEGDAGGKIRQVALQHRRCPLVPVVESGLAVVHPFVDDAVPADRVGDRRRHDRHDDHRNQRQRQTGDAPRRRQDTESPLEEDHQERRDGDQHPRVHEVAPDTRDVERMHQREAEREPGRGRDERACRAPAARADEDRNDQQRRPEQQHPVALEVEPDVGQTLVPPGQVGTLGIVRVGEEATVVPDAPQRRRNVDDGEHGQVPRNRDPSGPAAPDQVQPSHAREEDRIRTGQRCRGENQSRRGLAPGAGLAACQQQVAGEGQEGQGRGFEPARGVDRPVGVQGGHQRGDADRERNLPAAPQDAMVHDEEGDRAHVGHHAPDDRPGLGRRAETQPRGAPERPEKVRVALDPFPRIEDQTVSLDEVARIAERYVRVVADPRPPEGMVGAGHDCRAAADDCQPPQRGQRRLPKTPCEA